MAIRIELMWDKSTTVGEVEHFVSQVRTAGAGTDTVIEDITHDQDPNLILGWQVEVEGDNGSVPVSEVTMPHRLMWNLHSLLEQITSGDGDVRALQDEVGQLDAQLWDALMKHVG